MSYISDDGLVVSPDNINGKFRDAFESFTDGVNWTLSKDSNDIVQLDGNAISASYLVISKDPLTTGGITTLTMNQSYQMPIETAVGIHASQRTLGQEFALELISDEDSLPSVDDIAISSIVQSATTLTVTTSTPHGLVAGKRIGIYGVPDSRLNYPAIVIASITSDTQFTCTGGPAGTITSVTSSTYNTGYVTYRPALGYAKNGVSHIFENSSTTNASFYSRANAGDSLPSGTYSSNHSSSVASISSVTGITSAYTYSFLPTSEYRFTLQADRAQWQDAAVDTSSVISSRLIRTQVVPDPAKNYKLRFRCTNNKSLPIPNAKIVSAVKTGTATATITTEAPHGLTTSDFVNIYGIGDTANFANVTTAIQVLSTPTSTTFTVSFGTTATATSYGGLVSRAQGSQTIQGMQTTVASQASSTSTQLTLIGSASWSLSIGDYVNVYGLRNRTTGADLGFDGAYKVVNQYTSTLVLEPLPGTTLPSAISTTNTGGAVIRRTDLRISFVRLFDYTRQRVEVAQNGAGSMAIPSYLIGGSISSGSITPVSSNIYSLLTSTNLTGNASYVGSSSTFSSSSTSSTLYYTSVVVAVQHTAGLVPGTLYYEVGSETSSTAPTTWYPAFTIPIPSTSSWTCFTLPISTRWYRFRFVNGATAQTSFRLATILQYNGSMSNGLSYPDTITYPLSTTALTANSTFTSATLDFGDTMSIYKTITAQVYTDQASATNGFKIQVSRDGTNWRDADSATVSAGVITRVQWGMIYRYARVVYTNGASSQGSFELFANADVR